MEFFDCHCDYLWASETGKETRYNPKLNGKTVMAVFEGSQSDKELVLRQINAYKKSYKTRIAFEGLGWVKGLKDAEIILDTEPLYVGPMWNNKNQFGGSCKDDGELTKFGECFLSEFDERNIYIDLAHSGEYMFFSCAERFENVIFSHGNVYEICPNKRNINKKQIQKLIEKNSFMGLNFFTEFIGENGEEDILKHIDYVLSLGGENILGIGSDIDGCDSIIFQEFPDPYTKLFDKLLQQNYEEKVIKKIFFGNLQRIENQNVKYAEKIKKFKK